MACAGGFAALVQAAALPARSWLRSLRVCGEATNSVWCLRVEIQNIRVLHPRGVGPPGHSSVVAAVRFKRAPKPLPTLLALLRLNEKMLRSSARVLAPFPPCTFAVVANSIHDALCQHV